MSALRMLLRASARMCGINPDKPDPVRAEAITRLHRITTIKAQSREIIEYRIRRAAALRGLENRRAGSDTHPR